MSDLMQQSVVPKGYKLTEVGVIPEDWEVDQLDEFWSVTDCKHVTAKFVPNGFPLASIKEVQSRYVDLRNAKHTTHDFYKLLTDGKRKLVIGDLILSRNATVGEVAQVMSWHPVFAMGQDVCLLRKRTESWSSGFLQELFAFESIKKQLDDCMVGTTFKRVNVRQVKALLVQMPQPEEQTAIANVLSDTDALITSLETLIAKKRAIKTASMQQLLTGKKRLPPFDKSHSGYKQTELGEIPEDWEVESIKNLLSITTGDKNTQDKIEDGAYPFFVRSQKVEHINSFSFDGEAVLTAGDGVGTGKIYHYINGKFDFHQRVYLMHNFVDKLNGYYFYIYFSNNFYNRIMSMTAKSSVDSVRREMIAEMKVVLPSAEEQKMISEVLSAMNDEVIVLEQRLSKIQQIKQGMMQELLTGKTRLIANPT